MDVKQLPYWLVRNAARKVGLLPKSLVRAVKRGLIPHETLEDGTPIVRLSDVKYFKANRPKRGKGSPLYKETKDE